MDISEIVSEIVGILKEALHRGPAERKIAIDALLKVGTAEAKDAVLDALEGDLKYGSTEGQLSAIEALAQVGGERATAALKEHGVGDRDSRHPVYVAALKALCLRMDGLSDPDLFHCACTSRNEELEIAAAAHAAKRQDFDALMKVQRVNDKVTRAVLEALKKSKDERASEAIAQFIGHGDGVAVDALNLLKERRVFGPILRAAKSQGDDQVRRCALEMLGEIAGQKG